MITFSVVTASQVIAKKRTLMPDGTLHKETSANVHEGIIQIEQAKTAAEFAEGLEALQTNQCFVYGVLPVAETSLVTREEWHRRGRPGDVYPRTKELMKWPQGAGVLMLDYDAPKDNQPPLARDALLALAREVCTDLAQHPHIWFPSSSSHIFTDDGRELEGLKGQRIYVMVRDATDIERAGRALNDRLWAQGHGRFEVSDSGSLLERPVFDGSVWQTNRIDFAAGAHCWAGLQQRRGKPLVFNGDSTELLDTRAAIPDLKTAETADAARNKAAARAAKQALAAAMREQWLNSRADEIVSRNPRMARADAIKQARRASEQRELGANWLIQTQASDSTVETVSVGEVLDDPKRYHGRLTRDPIEPGYDGTRWVGILYLIGQRPVLHSQAHGGVTFRMSRQPVRIGLDRGKGSEATDEVLNVLRTDPDFFDFGSSLVVSEGGQLHPLNEHSLRYEIGRRIQFYRTKRRGDGSAAETLEDAPFDLCRNILALGTRRGLKNLDAVLSAPTLRTDGSVLALPGYDEQTRLLIELDSDVLQAIPDHPTREQALAALQFLWTAFADFPFVDALSRAVHLAALLTVAVRPVLPTAPAFAYDAPVQGSGKTLLARCVGILAEGREPNVYPHVHGRDDEEIRKRLFGIVRQGTRAVVWDNVVGNFDSASMAGLLTSQTFTDRVLGKSENNTVPNRTVLLMTGNNLTLANDMARRVLVARIDPETDQPFARSFDLDPAGFCLANRQQMIEAALTVMRAMLTHGCNRPGKGRMASFESWDEWVRQSVVFANEIWPGQFGDVMDAVMLNQVADPEQESLLALLNAWETLFGNGSTTTAQVVREATEEVWTERQKTFRDALAGFSTDGRLTNKGVGRLLRYRVGRVCGGMKLEDLGTNSSGARRWRVVRINPHFEPDFEDGDGA